jgi:hypothetical protein
LLVAVLAAACRSSSHRGDNAATSTTTTRRSVSTTSTTDFFQQPPSTKALPALPACGRQLGSYLESNQPVPNEPTSHVAVLVLANNYGPDCSIGGFVDRVSFSGPAGSTDDIPTTATHLGKYPSSKTFPLRLDPDTGKPAAQQVAFEIYSTTLDTSGHACPAGHMVTGLNLAWTPPDTTLRFETLNQLAGSSSNAVSSCDGRIAITALHDFVGE